MPISKPSISEQFVLYHIYLFKVKCKLVVFTSHPSDSFHRNSHFTHYLLGLNAISADPSKRRARRARPTVVHRVEHLATLVIPYRHVERNFKDLNSQASLLPHVKIQCASNGLEAMARAA